jgi:hypothetical protein
MSKYSSFKDHQLITENWRRFVAEAERKGPYSGISYDSAEEIEGAHRSMRSDKATGGKGPSIEPDWKRQASLVQDAIEAGDSAAAEQRLNELEALAWLLAVNSAEILDVTPGNIRPIWGELTDAGENWPELATQMFNDALGRWNDNADKVIASCEGDTSRCPEWKNYLKTSLEQFKNWGFTSIPKQVDIDSVASISARAGGQGLEAIRRRVWGLEEGRSPSDALLLERGGVDPKIAKNRVAIAIDSWKDYDTGIRGTALVNRQGDRVTLWITGGKILTGREGGNTGRFIEKKLTNQHIEKLRRRDNQSKNVRLHVEWERADFDKDMANSRMNPWIVSVNYANARGEGREGHMDQHYKVSPNEAVMEPDPNAAV